MIALLYLLCALVWLLVVAPELALEAWVWVCRTYERHERRSSRRATGERT